VFLVDLDGVEGTVERVDVVGDEAHAYLRVDSTVVVARVLAAGRPTALLLMRDTTLIFQLSFVPALVVTEGGPPPHATTYLSLFTYRNVHLPQCLRVPSLRVRGGSHDRAGRAHSARRHRSMASHRRYRSRHDRKCRRTLLRVVAAEVKPGHGDSVAVAAGRSAP